MQLINNRYRVISLLEQTYQITSYLVSDILRNHENLCIHILNLENIPDSILGFLTEDFLDIKNANNSGIINIYQFNLITSIDGRPLKELSYFYSTEYVGKNVDSLQYIRGLKDGEKLSLFVEICKCVNALHLKGVTYGSIRPSNIIVLLKDYKIEIKLRDLASTRIESFDLWKSNMRDNIYRAPELSNGKEATKASDIYSLGMLLIRAFDIHVPGGEKGNDRKALPRKLFKLANKMISLNPEDRFQSLNDVIKYINVDFNNNYSAFSIEEREKLNFNLKLVGREYPKLEAYNAYQGMKNKRPTFKLLSLHGEGGVGKTRLLREIKHRFKMSGAKVYHAFSLDETSRYNNKASVSVFKKFISNCNSKILEKYESELVKFIPEIGEGKQILPSAPLVGEKEKLRLLNRLSNFLFDFSQEEPVVLIVDNINLADAFFMELVEYFYTDSSKSSNFMIVFSYEDSEYTGNQEFREFLDRLSTRHEFINIKLNTFSVDETSEFIRNILGMPHKPVNFAKRIYSQTFGNPLFTEEVIKNLFSRHALYINPDNGNWTTDYDMEDVPVPDNMEQAILNQIKEVDNAGLELLNTMSIFNGPVSIDIISRIMNQEPGKIQNSIDDLVWRGILSQSIHDKGFMFDFYNKILKKLLYTRLGEYERRTRHEMIAKALEEIYEQEDKSTEEELIYHLEMAGEREKLIKYCTENAYNLEKFNVRDGAVRNLEKAIGLLESDPDDKRIIELLIKVGDIYVEDGRVDFALKYYSRAVKLSDRLNLPQYQIDSLSKIADVYYSRGEIEKSLEYVEDAEYILNNFQYIEGILSVKILRARIFEKKQDYAKALEQCEEGLSLCQDKNILEKGKLLHVLGNFYYFTGKIEDAMRTFEESIKYCERSNYLKGTLSPLNNIGVIYAEHFQDTEKSLEYFYKLKDISERNNFVQSEVLALVNIADSHFNNYRYEESLEFFKEALEKAERYEFETLVFYCYIYLTHLYYLLGDFANAYRYFELTNDELLAHPEQGRQLADFYRVASQMSCNIGALDEGEVLIDKALNRYSNEESILKWYSQIIKEYIQLRKSTSEKDVRNTVQRIKFYASKFVKAELKLNIIYDICIDLYSMDYIAIARDLFWEFDCSTEVQRLQVKRLYLTGILTKDSTRINLLNQSIEINKKVKDKQLQWRLFSAVGDYYFARKSYFYAVNYYFDACEVVRDLAFSVPEGLRVGFVNQNFLYEPLCKLFMVKQHYNNIYDENTEGLQKIKTLRDLDTLFKLVDLKDIITNKHFIKSAQSIYDTLHGNAAENIKDLMQKLHSDSLENLEMILKYAARITLAGSGYILSEEYSGSYNVLSSLNYDKDEFDNRFIIDKVRASKKPLIIASEIGGSNENLGMDVISPQIKAVICIPIIMKQSGEDSSIVEERRNIVRDNGQIIGYIYLQSEKILNNFNQNTLSVCSELVPLIGLIIEKYQLRISSSIDKLTGTLTRKYLEDFMLEQLENAQAVNKPLSILMFDLDNFKGINDSFGHQTGDEVLKSVCDIVMKNIRKVDSCGRYGGEEFLVILPDTNLEGAKAVAEKLRQKIEDKRVLGDKRDVTVSIGIAAYPSQGSTSQELIEKADQALYVAKETGRNRSQIWQKEFSGKVKGTYKLTGIVSGNTVQDYRNVSVMIDIIDLVKKDAPMDQKVFELLGRVIEITESQQGILFVLENGEIKDSYGRKMFHKDWIDVKNYNKALLNSVIENKQGMYLIDWDEIFEYDAITGLPDWKSVTIVPMINSGMVKGVLYLSTSAKMKEYKFDDFNFINTLGQIALAML